MVAPDARFKFRDVHTESDVLVEVCPHLLDFSGLYAEAYYRHTILNISPIIRGVRLEIMVICTICNQPIAVKSYDKNYFLCRTLEVLHPE